MFYHCKDDRMEIERSITIKRRDGGRRRFNSIFISREEKKLTERRKGWVLFGN